jgi:hypothetical protein
MAVPLTVPALMLRHELDRLRQASRVDNDRAARELGCQVSKISRIFLGQSRITAGDTKLLADLYGADKELTDALVELARGLGRRDDWADYQAVYREAFFLLPDLERHSSRIRMAQSEIIPGLLQTDDYVRALNEVPTPFPPSIEIRDAVRVSRERRAILTREQPTTTFAFVLSESALRRQYGDQKMMRSQLEHLMEIGRQPNVQLQVLPFANPNPVTFASLSFELLHVPGPGGAPLDFVYLEQYDDASYLDSQGRVAAYEQLSDNLQAAALGPTESAGFIEKVAANYG